jgi:hypothetical protein
MGVAKMRFFIDALRGCAKRIGKKHKEPKPDADGWLEWKGGARPFSGSPLCEIVFRDGGSEKTYSPGTRCWYHVGGPRDIMFYRIITYTPPSKKAWANVYKHPKGALLFASKHAADMADLQDGESRVGCYPLEWPKGAPWPWGDE